MGKYLKNNFENSRQLYEKKIIYSTDIIEGSRLGSNVVDFNRGERVFYGRMNIAQLPVSLMDSTALLTIGRSSDAAVPHKAIKFVVRAFNEMAANFEKAAMSGHISANEKYLSNLKVFKGFESPWMVYQKNYKEVYFNSISEQFKNELNLSNQIKNMDTFIELLIEYLPQIVQNVPITYTGFIKSKFCDIMKTGLALELCDISYSDDQSKMKHFVNSPNWQYYVNACSAHGFIIDKNYPGRIVADIGSNLMINAARKYNVFSGRLIFDTLYDMAHKTCMQSFLNILIELYNACKLPRYAEYYVCADGTTKKKLKFPERYDSVKDFFKERAVTTQRIIHLYMLIRLNEQKPSLNESEKNILIKDCLRMMAIKKSFALCLNLFEVMIASSFDKPGSFSYYIEMHRAILLDAFDRGQIESIEIGNIADTTSGGGY